MFRVSFCQGSHAVLKEEKKHVLSDSLCELYWCMNEGGGERSESGCVISLASVTTYPASCHAVKLVSLGANLCCHCVCSLKVTFVAAMLFDEGTENYDV